MAVVGPLGAPGQDGRRAPWPDRSRRPDRSITTVAESWSAPTTTEADGANTGASCSTASPPRPRNPRMSPSVEPHPTGPGQHTVARGPDSTSHAVQPAAPEAVRSLLHQAGCLRRPGRCGLPDPSGHGLCDPGRAGPRCRPLGVPGAAHRSTWLRAHRGSSASVPSPRPRSSRRPPSPPWPSVTPPPMPPWRACAPWSSACWPLPRACCEWDSSRSCSVAPCSSATSQASP